MDRADVHPVAGGQRGGGHPPLLRQGEAPDLAHRGIVLRHGGPGRPVRAMWKASWIAAGTSRGSWIISECLTTGIVMPVTSAS